MYAVVLCLASGAALATDDHWPPSNRGDPHPARPRHRGFVPPQQITAVVRAAGLEPTAPPVLAGEAYLVSALDPWGRPVRVAVDARFRDILTVQPMRGPRPYFRADPRYGPPPEALDVAPRPVPRADPELATGALPPPGAQWSSPVPTAKSAPPVVGAPSPVPRPRPPAPPAVVKVERAKAGRAPDPVPLPDAIPAGAEAAAPAARGGSGVSAFPPVAPLE
jgi:hypothetical protein